MGIFRKLRHVALDQTTKVEHSEVGEEVKDDHQDREHVCQRHDHLAGRLNNDAEDTHLVQQIQELEETDEDDDLILLDKIVIQAKVVQIHQNTDCRINVKNLAHSLRPDTEFLLKCFEKTHDAEVDQQLDQPDCVSDNLEEHPPLQETDGLSLPLLQVDDHHHVQECQEIHAKLVLRRRKEGVKPSLALRPLDFGG